MRRCLWAVVMAGCALGAAACGGYGTTTVGPAGPTAPPPDSVVIEIKGINGALSFSPNPAVVPAGRTIVWHNVDTTTHRVVFDDGELDTGNIAPGAFSEPMGIVAPTPYHCSIHPPMVGQVTSGSQSAAHQSTIP